uniref:ABC transporter permease subunit n=1 Tax=Clostridium sp. NkU-1 TaxID=1095009 RepID=UPI0006D181C7
MDNIWVGIFALSLTAICSISEAVRGALLSIDKGQDEAGYSIGLTKVQTIRRIIIPQMIPAAIPTLINHVVGLIKHHPLSWPLESWKLWQEPPFQAPGPIHFFEGYMAAAVIYWAFTIVIECLAKVLRRHTGKFRRNPYD